MSKLVISTALESIWETIEALEDGYWEASAMADKDLLFSLIQMLYREYNELLKVSVQDHHFPYEVIGVPQQQFISLLGRISQQLPQLCQRPTTQDRLQSLCSLLLRSIQ
ncbi:hypothetical protein [Oceanobacter mangrovi]|uniref:hypothetical protein n=1 Tax=Oceanobacter mangrovi TaxID=2862510 RepID=UPI001C8E9051|nr:hypothetical protein [Oceanobacter mangrovi]